jgi:hypothetical protein
VRLITRADLDGLVSGVFITIMERIEEILFIEPNPMQKGAIEVKPGDIIANLPYHPNCDLWFDHHVSNHVPTPFHGRHRLAPSAARVVYEFYDDERLRKYEPMLVETDRIDSADLRQEETLDPQGYLLLAMTVDGKDDQDRPYWIKLIGLLRDLPIEKILLDPEVAGRCQSFRAQQKVFKEVLLKHTRLVQGRIILTDLRGAGEPAQGNRFLIYSLFPQGLVSVKLAEDSTRQNQTAISVGKNIFDKSFPINVGEFLTRFGGGGHTDVGSCRVPRKDADHVLHEILRALEAS